MSIATAVKIQPSKLSRKIAILFSLSLVSIGIYIGFLQHLQLYSQCIFALLCFFAAWQSYAHNQKLNKTSWNIMIDGQGQLRGTKIVCQHGILKTNESVPIDSFAENEFMLEGNILTLVSGTTLWPHVLFLRLHNVDNKITTNLVVLRDSMSKDEFRRLSLACRWIVKNAH